LLLQEENLLTTKNNFIEAEEKKMVNLNASKSKTKKSGARNSDIVNFHIDEIVEALILQDSKCTYVQKDVPRPNEMSEDVEVNGLGTSPCQVVNVSSEQEDIIVMESSDGVIVSAKSDDGGNGVKPKSVKLVNGQVHVNGEKGKTSAGSDNVGNSAIVERGNAQVDSTAIQEAKGCRVSERLSSAENSTCSSEEMLRNTARTPPNCETGRNGIEPQPGCSNDVTDDEGLNGGQHQGKATVKLFIFPNSVKHEIKFIGMKIATRTVHYPLNYSALSIKLS
jgi:hypothetical protein